MRWNVFSGTRCLLPSLYYSWCNRKRSYTLCACRGNRRVKPKFDIADWNVFNRVLSGEPRTNNAFEAWNGSFNKFVSTKHPAFPKLITRFKDEQKNAKTNVERLMSDDVIRKPRPKYSLANEKLVQNAKNYNQDHIQKYLKLCTFDVHMSQNFMHSKFVLIFEICYLMFHISLLKC